MATAFELSGEELVHNLAGHVGVDEATGHHQHVGIIVLTDQVGNLWNPAESCTDALVLVERHVDALARTADGDTGIHLALFDSLSQSMTEIGVVSGGLVIGAVVLIGVALFFEICLNELF